MRKTKLAAIFIVTWLAFTGLAPAGFQPSSAATSSGTIAYIRGTDIRLIQPDGSNDHSIYTRPDPGADESYFFQDLVWRPDSAALAFVSDQENSCSYWNQDVFTIRPDGSGLKRITNSPACAELASLPKKGTVTIPISTSEPTVLGYVQRAPQAKFVVSGNATLNNVADFGPGVKQLPVAIYGVYRVYGGLPADVQAGKTVSTGPISVYVASWGERLAGAWKPSWSNDSSKLGFVYTNCGTAYQIWANPAYGTLGTSVIEGAASGIYPCVVDWGRSPNRANQFLYTTALTFDAEANPVLEGIFLATEGAALPSTPLVTADYGDNIIDVKWLPDGSGFLFAKLTVGLGYFYDIFHYDFTTGQATNLTNSPAQEEANPASGAIRKLSISPDGQSVVFDRAADQNSRTGDLYLMGIDGSNPTLLVHDAAFPTWSRGDVQSSLSAVGTGKKGAKGIMPAISSCSHR